MQRSWSMPVAQAMQRHSGGWSSKPMAENPERDDRQGTRDTERRPALDKPPPR